MAGKRIMPRLGTADLVASQVKDLTGIRRNPGNQNYLKTSYTRDCIIILIIASRLTRNKPGYKVLFLRESLINIDIDIA